MLCYEIKLKGALAPVRAARTSQGTSRDLAPVCAGPLAPIRGTNWCEMVIASRVAGHEPVLKVNISTGSWHEPVLKPPFAYSSAFFLVEGVRVVCLFVFLSYAQQVLDEMSKRMMPI
jgi:hypothetical protein